MAEVLARLEKKRQSSAAPTPAPTPAPAPAAVETVSRITLLFVLTDSNANTQPKPQPEKKAEPEPASAGMPRGVAGGPVAAVAMPRLPLNAIPPQKEEAPIPAPVFRTPQYYFCFGLFSPLISMCVSVCF